MRNRHVDDLTQLAVASGIMTEVVRGSKHVQIKLQRGAGRALVVVGSTPSDHRAFLNNRARMRRAIRELLS